jgi:hypothetical protein
MKGNRSGVQGSAPPAKQTAGQIEKETEEWILILK